MTTTYTKAIARAQKYANQNHATWCVVELDSDDMERRIIRTMPLEQTEYDEFAAWEGRILEVIEPNTPTRTCDDDWNDF